MQQEEYKYNILDENNAESVKGKQNWNFKQIELFLFPFSH